MQGMSSDVPEVSSVLGMLPTLGNCKEPLDAQAVGTMLMRYAGHER
jgi:hypothetical protein